jgi:CDP-glucose 4,6-dehydratase
MENLAMSKRLSTYYKNKKVFVTGHTGFKGGWLVGCLHLLGAKIKGYALEPEYDNGIFEWLQRTNAVGENVIADIRDKHRLQYEVQSFEPDYIFHLAAQPLVIRSYEIPAETFEVNVIGTCNLLENVRALQKKCTIVVVTTDKVYDNKERNILYKEGDDLGGYDPYSASKACTELIVNSFRNSFFNLKSIDQHQKAIATARAGNVIGGGDWSQDRLIPDIVRSLCRQETIDVRNPSAVRPWQHVLEPIGGYLLLGGLLNGRPRSFSKAYNFGPLPKDHLSVKQLVKTAIKNWGGGKWRDVSNANQIHEAGLLKLNISRAKKELSWRPKMDSPKAIGWTIDWYKRADEEKAEFTFKQIRDYFEL